MWGHLSYYPVWENNEGNSKSCKTCKSWAASHLCCHSVCALSANSTMISMGQVKEGALCFPLTFSLGNITWIFDWGVAMPVCKLHCPYVTVLAPEVLVALVAFSNSDSSGCPRDLLWTGRCHPERIYCFQFQLQLSTGLCFGCLAKPEHSFFILQHRWLESAMNYNSLLKDKLFLQLWEM